MKKILFTAATVLLTVFVLAAINLRGDDFGTDTPVEVSQEVHEEILRVSTSEDWWDGNFLTATGRGVAPKDVEVTHRTKELARRAAMTDAYRNLAEKIGTVRITAEKTLVKKEIQAVIKFASIVSEEYDDFGNCTIVMQIPLYGGQNSLATIIFQPVDKKDFPKPKKKNKTKGNYTGLIIDCGDAEITPVLSPEIHNDEKESIYGYSNLEYEKVISKGMIGYVKKDPYASDDAWKLVNTSGGKKYFSQIGSEIFIAKNDSRAGDNPLVIKVSELSDDGTCPVISGDDADKILAENNISHFLDDGAVVFTSNRIRGMRM